MDSYPVINVSDDAPHAQEAMGSKRKFWFVRDNTQWLFKYVRERTGEDWSEKIACELAGLLDLPHAEYELAEFRGARGTISKSFVPHAGALIHGNELLAACIEDYPTKTSYNRVFCRVPQHTLDAVLRVNTFPMLNLPSGWTPIDGIERPIDVLVGYLMLDAWIGNTDRHHENWAWLVLQPSTALPATCHLAPTFDHASSLGRNETDANRRKRLETKDAGYSILSYVERCRSALYASEEETAPLGAVDAFHLAAQRYPMAAKAWLANLDRIATNRIEQVFQRVPKQRMSLVAAEFAMTMLEHSRTRLLAIAEDLA